MLARSPRRLATVLAIAAATTVATTGSAQAADVPSLSVAPDGTAHAVWGQTDGAFALGQWGTRQVDGTLGETQYHTPGGFSAVHHRVVAGPDGRAVATWLSLEPGGGVIKLRRRAADGSLGVVQTVSSPGVQLPPEAAMDDDGNVTLAWVRMVDNKFVIEARRRAATGALSTVKRLSAGAPTYHALSPDLAVDPAGSASVTWTVQAPTPYVQARRRSADGTLSPTQNLTSGGGLADMPRVDVDANGNAVFAWRRNKGGVYVVQTRRRTAAGALSAVQDVSAAGADTLAPELAVSPAGTATIAWQEKSGANYVMQARRRSAGGTLGEVELVSPAGQGATGGRVDVDADGDAVFAWRSSSGTGIFARRRTAAGTWSSTQPISAEGAVVSDPQLAVEPGGAATLAWLRSDASPSRVEVRRRTAAGELSPIDKLSY